MRETVAKQLEEARNAGQIKGGLTAEVQVTSDVAALAKLGDELKFVLIVSKAGLSVSNTGTSVLVQRSEHARCERCWHQTPDVGSHAEHPDLCGRCVENAFGHGENRQFA